MTRTPSVFLLSPPFSLLPAPLLAVPLLKGYLRQRGIHCDSADLNVRFLHWLATDRGILDRCIETELSEFEALQARPDAEPPGTARLSRMMSALAIAPRDMLGARPGFRVASGEGGRHAGGWLGHMPSFMNALAMSGLFVHESGGKVPTPPESDSLLLRYDALEDYLETDESRSIVERAAASDVVGISVPFFGQQALAAYIVAQHIRAVGGEAYIVCGGSGLTQNVDVFRKSFARSGVIDAVGLYEGEETLSRLARCIVDGADLATVPNLLRLDSEAGCVMARAQLPGPDDLPAPVFDSEELGMYSELSGGWHEGIRLPLMISRGCWWDKCAFCNDKKIRHPETPPYQPRSPERVAEDVASMQKEYGASYFYLITSAMAPGWGRRFADAVEERAITARFWTYMRAMAGDSADRALFESMNAAGFDMVTVGVESVADRVLAAVGKGNDRADVLNTVRGLSDAGIKTKVNLIVDLPPSSVEDVRSNWQFVRENFRYIHDLTTFDFLLPEGTAMAEAPGKFGISIVKDEKGTVKMSSPGLIQHVNPLHQNEEARRLIDRIKEASVDMQFFRLTSDVMARLAMATDALASVSFRFRPFAAIRSRFSPWRADDREVFIVVLDDMYKFIVIPAEYRSFLESMDRGTRVPQAFCSLCEELTKGVAGEGSVADRQCEAEKILMHMAREGFVEDVLVERPPEREARNLRGVDEETDWRFTRREYPFVCSPFVFGAFDFATVASKKMA